MKAAVFCFSDSGSKLAERLCTLLDLKKECLHRHIPDDIGDLFAEKEALIFIGACGIAVRIIAPFVKSKMTDPAVIAADQSGVSHGRAKFSRPILLKASRHNCACGA